MTPETALARSNAAQELQRNRTLPNYRERILPWENRGEATALAGITHDARNLVTALKLCADLVADPGVFTPGHEYYAREIRAVATASEHLVGRLSSLAHTAARVREATAVDAPVMDLAEAVRQLGSLLSAMAGPAIALQISCFPCRGQLRLAEEDLTRILLNLIRNAADAMPSGGRIRITVHRGQGSSFLWPPQEHSPLTIQSAVDLWDEPPSPSSEPRTVLLTVEDSGPGIPPDLLERVFDPGFSTRRTLQPWPEAAHRGLGLSIVRQLVEAAGGTICAQYRPGSGACLAIELPLTNVIPSLPSEPAPADERSAQ